VSGWEELRRLEQGATKGPWSAEPYLIDSEYGRLRITSPSDGNHYNTAEAIQAADAEFIAAARNQLPSILAALDAVLASHRKSPVFDMPIDNCGHDYETFGFESDDGEIYCTKCVNEHTCAECADLSRDNMDGEFPDWPCATVRAITEALEGK
jgi:hypothetical protein